MNKRQENMEKMLALVMIAYSIGLLLGEAIRDRMYAQAGQVSRKWYLYSGLFVLLKQKISLSLRELRQVVAQVLCLFGTLVLGVVRT